MFPIRAVVFALVLLSAMPLRATEPEGAEAGKGQATDVVEKCEHGVKKSICTRCNPKLEAVFKAKNDWCAEHTRPESQCAICHPDLAAQGVT
jgi:hypothetical protein